jgi:adenylylsulfate kinase
MIFLFCGLSGAGKSTLARSVSLKLDSIGLPVEIIDGDEYRQVISKDLSFGKNDRCENMRRLAFVANKFASHGIITIISAINPYDEIRQELRNKFPDIRLIYVDCPVEVLKKRDTKGLYKKALLPDGAPGKIYNLTGVNDHFDVPENPDLHLDTSNCNVHQSTQALFNFITGSILLKAGA